MKPAGWQQVGITTKFSVWSEWGHFCTFTHNTSRPVSSTAIMDVFKYFKMRYFYFNWLKKLCLFSMIWKVTLAGVTWKHMLHIQKLMLLSRQHLFKARPCIFQQGNVKPHSSALTTAQIHSRGVLVLNWWPAVKTFHHLKHLTQKNMTMRTPRDPPIFFS